MRHPALLVVLLAAPVAAQEVRDPVLLNPTQTILGFGPAVAVEDDLACAVWTETFPNYFVWASVSDGRGIDWSTPVRLDSDVINEAKITSLSSALISGGVIHVSWRDDRGNGTDDEIYYTRSLDGGLSWELDRRVDHGYPTGANPVRSLEMAADSPYVYLAVRVDGITGNDEIWVAASSDDGATFAPAAYISSLPAGTADAINVDVAADGASCHVAWADDRQGTGEEVWYQRSDDAGATWLAADVQLDASPGGAGDTQSSTMVIGVDGDLVAVSWLEERTSASNEELYLNLSQDGGATWLAADVKVGNYDPLSADVDFNSMAVRDGAVLLAWRDDRTALDHVYAAITDDGGASFTEHLIDRDDDNTSPLAYGGPDGLFAISYAGGSTPQAHRVSFSLDGGAVFSPAVSLSGPLVGDTDQTALAIGERYRNLIGIWQQDDPGTNQVYAGGFRPQQLEQPTLLAGQAVSFVGSGFPAASAGTPMVVVISDAAGAATTPDGRDLGIAPGVFLDFTTTPGNLIQGALDPLGAATTAPVVLPPSLVGFTLHCVGVDFAPGSGGGSFTVPVVATVQ
jgi:hypothetical protein